MFAPQWSVKGEYLYYDLGTVTLNQPLTIIGAADSTGLVAGGNIQSAAHYRGNIAKAGVNYKFW